MKINNVRDALNWLINNPEKKLYDKYTNYYILASTGNYIEFHHYEVCIDDEGNDSSFWDYDLFNFSDFLKCNVDLETE